jgi:nucleoside-diphosphate-sugar epimerase
MLLAARNPDRAGRVYNLGGTAPINLRDLAGLLVKAAKQGEFVLREFPAERRKIDIGDFYADVGLITKALKWRPRTTPAVALAQTVEYFAKELPHYV